MRKFLSCLATAIPAALISTAAIAQSTYPTKPVLVIVPGAPGAGFDIHGRVFFEKLGQQMGQRFVMDFRPGAGQTIGTAHAARAANDGYTLLFTSGTHSAAQLLYKDLTYDPVKSFVTISQTTAQFPVLVANATKPFKTMQEYIAYGKANKGKINMGIAGNGGLSHYAAAWMADAAGIEITYVPYQSAGPMLVGLLGGDVDSGMPTLAAALPHIKSGRLVALGMTSSTRSTLMPDLPTLAEQGAPGFGYSQWQGVLAPVGTPTAIVNRLHQELVKVVKSPDVVAHLARYGDQGVGSSPEEFSAMLIGEVNRWKSIKEKYKLDIK